MGIANPTTLIIPQQNATLAANAVAGPSTTAITHANSPIERSNSRKRTRAELEREDDGLNEEDTEANRYCAFGYSKRPMIDIEPQNQLPDTLHMTNRVTDKLFLNFMNDLLIADDAMDGIYIPEKHKNVNMFLTLIKDKAKINIHCAGYTFIGIKNVLTSLTGDQRLAILSSIDINEHFRGSLGQKAELINWLWSWFYNTIICLKNYDEKTTERPFDVPNRNQVGRIDPDSLNNRNKLWCENYVSHYGAHNVTPYIHRFANHLADSYRRHGDVDKANCQGLEKSNHMLRRRYENANNKVRGQGATYKFLKPLLMKSLRLMYLQKNLNYHYDCNGKKILTNVRQLWEEEVEEQDEEDQDINNF